MTTRTFTPDELDAIGVPFEYNATGPAAEHLHEEQIDTRRWVSVHELIFRAPDDSKVYSVTYEEGLTEDQEGTDPWAGEDFITATEMEQRPVVRLEWQPVTQPVDRSVLDPAIRALVKGYEHNEETGEDTYRELVGQFEDILRAILTAPAEPQG